MTLNDLYKKLDMERPEDFEYFEQLADLLEAEEDVPFDLFFTVLSKVDAETAGELTENYFEELLNAIPDEENELASIVDSIEQNLLLLAADLDRSESRRSFAEQLYKFSQWYKKPGNAAVDGSDASVLEAVFCAREDKLSGGSHSLDFAMALDYDLDDVSYGLGDFKEIDVVGKDSDE